MTHEEMLSLIEETNRRNDGEVLVLSREEFEAMYDNDKLFELIG